MRARGLTATVVTVLCALASASQAQVTIHDHTDGRHPPPPIAAPAVSGFSPQSGSVGTKVTVTGSGFLYGTRLLIGGQPLKWDSVSNNAITFRVPARFGDGMIVLRVAGAASDLVVGTFVVMADPVLVGFAPTSGPSGTRVELSGSGFAASDQVIYNGRRVAIIEGSGSRIVVEIPPGATSDYFTVSRPGAYSKSSQRFLVTLPAPFVTSFAPTEGPPGTRVRLAGGNFGPDARVFYGRFPLPVIGRGPDFLVVEVPLGARRDDRFTVADPRGEVRVPQPFQLLVNPIISRFTPTYGAPRTVVTIEGDFFRRGDTLYLGNQRVNYDVIDGRHLRAEIPPGAASDSFAIDRGGTIVARSRDRFQVLRAPILSSFSPAGGPPGTKVTLNGNDFTPDVRVIYGAQPVAIVGRSGDSLLEILIPPGASDQPFTVQTAAGEARSPVAFNVWNYSVLDSVSPTSGPIGTRVTIRGRAFGRSDDFFLSGVQLPIIDRRPGQYVVEIPAGATSGVIEWASFGRRGPSRFRFDVLSPPMLSSVTPGTGNVGTQVSLSGSGFTPATQVFFGNLACPVYRRFLPGQIIVLIPQGAQGLDYFFVEDNGQRVRSPQPFEVMAPLSLSSFSPGSGPVGGSVTLVGSGFSEQSQAFYGTAAASIIRRQLPTVLVVSVPAAEPADYFYVSDRGARVRSGDMFRIFESPVVRSFSPEAGPVGTQVTIFGTGFGPLPKVWFGHQVVPVIQRTDSSQFMIVIPPGAHGRDNFRIEDQGTRLQTDGVFTVTDDDDDHDGHHHHHHDHDRDR